MFETICLILFIFSILLIGFFINDQAVSEGYEEPKPLAKNTEKEPIHCESEETCKP